MEGRLCLSSIHLQNIKVLSDVNMFTDSENQPQNSPLTTCLIFMKNHDWSIPDTINILSLTKYKALLILNPSLNFINYYTEGPSVCTWFLAFSDRPHWATSHLRIHRGQPALHHALYTELCDNKEHLHLTYYSVQNVCSSAWHIASNQ